MSAVFVGTQVQSAVLGWQVYELTGDPLSLGLVGLAEAVPFLALTLVGGWVADQRSRRLLSVLSLLVIGAAGALLLAISVFKPQAVGLLYAAQGLAGVGRAFFRPASAALGTELVPREHYQNAATWRSSALHSTMVLGPALGGGLIAVGGVRLAYSVVVALAAVGLAQLLVIPGRPSNPGPGGGLLDGLVGGVRYVFATPLLLAPMSLDLFAVLFGGATALLPIFARDVLQVGEVGFGFLRAAPALGSVVMSLVLARLGPMRRAGQKLLWAVALFGCTWVLFALSRSYAVSLVLLAVGGALDSVSVVLRGTLVQLKTPQAMMGRVSAVNGFFIGSSNELGAFESGVAARLLGLIPSVIFGASMTLLTVGLVAWRAPGLRTLDQLHEKEPSP